MTTRDELLARAVKALRYAGKFMSPFWASEFKRVHKTDAIFAEFDALPPDQAVAAEPVYIEYRPAGSTEDWTQTTPLFYERMRKMDKTNARKNATVWETRYLYTTPQPPKPALSAEPVTSDEGPPLDDTGKPMFAINPLGWQGGWKSNEMLPNNRLSAELWEALEVLISNQQWELLPQRGLAKKVVRAFLDSTQ